MAFNKQHNPEYITYRFNFNKPKDKVSWPQYVSVNYWLLIKYKTIKFHLMFRNQTINTVHTSTVVYAITFFKISLFSQCHAYAVHSNIITLINANLYVNMLRTFCLFLYKMNEWMNEYK